MSTPDAPPIADPLLFAPAHEIVAQIHGRRVSGEEFLDALLAHIARHNPQLSAIVTLDEAGARRRAQEADVALARGELWGPLHGLPVTLKDFHLTAGMRTTWGSGALANHIPTHDSAVPARLKAAGAIILGKTNIALGFPNNPLPRANNPWDLERTPGGSSTGPAAAVAAGLSPLDIGSDAGGSILGPAHYCGIFGMRHTEGRVSMAGLSGEGLPDPYPIWRIVMALGPMARSARDLHLAMQVIAGPGAEDPLLPPIPWRPLPTVALRGLRVAWAANFGTPVAPDIAGAIEGLARELAAHGALVEASLPEVDLLEQTRLSSALFSLVVGGANPHAEASAATRLSDYFQALARRDALTIKWERFFERWDVLLCPLEPITAPLHTAEAEPLVIDGVAISPEQRDVPFAISAVTGGPAITIPIGLDRKGLPIGAMLVGRRWDDERLLAIAEQIAQLAGGYRRPPGF
jgi:amidase